MGSLTGQLLLSNASMFDPNFRRTVVLIGHHDEEGAVGVVLNRPFDVTVDEAVPPLAELVREGEALFHGGPVQPEAAVVVADFEDPSEAGVVAFDSIGFSIEGLGKVALFAHFQGGKRWPGKEAGNIRIFSFEPGWFWYIPFHNGTSSVGCVLHARTVRGREGNLEQLYESLITRCRGLVDALDGAPRITPVHSAANFSYQTEPAVGDRFVCVGDAIAFLDPIFSSGVYLATQSAELSSAEILKAFRENRFEARRFRAYQKAIRRGMQPFQRFIRNFYDPSFTEVFLNPREFAGMVDGVTGVLAGGAFLRMSLRMRLSLEVFFTVVRINRWVRRRRGLATESRFKW